MTVAVGDDRILGRSNMGGKSSAVAWGPRLKKAVVGMTVSAVVVAGVAFGAAAPASAADPIPGIAPIEQRNPGTRVSADALPSVQIDSGIVWTQVIAGNTVFAGGSFSNARPAGSNPGQNLMPRSNILAYDINTGVATPFAPAINGTVKALALSPDRRTLYVGGSFTQVDGQPRYMHRSVCLALKSGIGRGGAYVIGSGHAAANVSVTRRQTGDKLWTVLMPIAAVSLIHR